MMLRYESAQIICFQGLTKILLPGLTKIQASVHWHSFGWNTFGWCPLFQTSKKLWRMGSPMEKRYLLLKPKKATGKHDNWRSWTYHPKSMPFWNHWFAVLHQCWISKKSQKHTWWPSHLVQHRNVYPKTSQEPDGVPALTSWRAKIALLHPGKSCGRHRLLWSIQISTPCCWNGMR